MLLRCPACAAQRRPGRCRAARGAPGRNTSTKSVMIATQPAKKRKMPYCIVQSMVRKACPRTAVKIKLTETVIAWPVERVSSGWISDGTSQPSGPQDQAKPLVKMETSTMMPTAICARGAGARRSARAPAAGPAGSRPAVAWAVQRCGGGDSMSLRH